MIQQGDIARASFDVRRRAKLTHAHEVDNCVYVIPFDETKEKRAVIWLAEGILCVATDGVYCEANSFGNVCYHALAANRRRDINRKRRATLARKKEQRAA